MKHWRQHNDDKITCVNTTIKDKIIRLYMSSYRVSFNRWKLLHSQNKITERKDTIVMKQNEQLCLQNDVILKHNANTVKNEEHEYQRQRHLLKCIEAFESRFLHIALGRWKDNVNNMNIKEDGAAVIIRRLRLRLLRKTIDLYIEGVAYSKKV